MRARPIGRARGRGPATGHGRAAPGTWPVVLLFAIIVGSIYGRVFAATEAAVSPSATIATGFLEWRLSLHDLWESPFETCLQTSAIFLIAAAAKIFVAVTGATPAAVDAVTARESSPVVLLALIAPLYLGLRIFPDPIGIIIPTLPFTVPLVESLGMDLIWFGVVVIEFPRSG